MALPRIARIGVSILFDLVVPLGAAFLMQIYLGKSPWYAGAFTGLLVAAALLFDRWTWLPFDDEYWPGFALNKAVCIAGTILFLVSGWVLLQVAFGRW